VSFSLLLSVPRKAVAAETMAEVACVVLEPEVEALVDVEAVVVEAALVEVDSP
jgi:hypothetical protein